MNEVEITRRRLEIVQWLPSTDVTGQMLYESVSKNMISYPDFEVRLSSVNSQSEFIQLLKQIASEASPDNWLTLHIIAHGDENGIGASSADRIFWKDLFALTRSINEVTQTLTLVMSSCVSAGIMSLIEPHLRAPFMFFVANTRSVMVNDARNGFPEFYKDYTSPLSLPKSVERLNSTIDFSQPLPDGNSKHPFYCQSVAYIFDNVFDPGRPESNFEKIMRVKYAERGLIITEQDIVREKKAYKEKAQQLKPYFLFQEPSPISNN